MASKDHVREQVTPQGRERVAAAVLAAGSGNRLGAEVPKPLVVLDDRPLVSYALAAAVSSGLEPVVLVAGAGADEVAELAPVGVDVVVNARWHEGLSTSVAALIEFLEPTDVDAVVIALGDQPFVGPQSYRRIAAAYDGGAQIVVATYEGRRANPVLLSRSVWADARRLSGDTGARVLMADHDVVEISCDGTGDPTDVDTPADLAAMEARCRSKTASE